MDWEQREANLAWPCTREAKRTNIFCSILVRGKNGTHGKVGLDGAFGNPGQVGSISYFWLHDNIREPIASLYKLELVDFHVASTLDEKRVASAQPFQIDCITLRNTGGVTLPNGYKCRLSITNGIQAGTVVDVLVTQSIEPQQTLQLDTKLAGIVSAKPGTTLDIVVEAVYGACCMATLKKQYQVAKSLQLKLLTQDAILIFGKPLTLKFEIVNHSTFDYHDIECQAILDTRIVFSSTKQNESQIVIDIPAQKVTPFSFTSMLQTWYFVLIWLVQISEPLTPFFELLRWKVKLANESKRLDSLKGVIESRPHYYPISSTTKELYDVLLMYNENMPQKELLFYQRAFHALGLTCNFFKNDANISMYSIPFQGRLIVYALNEFKSSFYLEHFLGFDKSKSYDSGMILVQPSVENVLQVLMDMTPVTPIDDNQLTEAFWLQSPNPEAFEDCIKKYVGTLKQQLASKHVMLQDASYGPKKSTTVSYVLGRATVKVMPLSRIERLLTLPYQPPSAVQNVIMTDSPFFKLLVALIQAAPIRQKMNMIKAKGLIKEENWAIRHAEHGYDIALNDIFKTELYFDMKRQAIYSDLPMSRLSAIVTILQAELYEFATREAIYIIWFSVYRLTLDHAFWSSKQKEINHLASIVRELLFDGEMKKNVNELDKIRYEAETDAKTPFQNIFQFASMPLMKDL